MSNPLFTLNPSIMALHSEEQQATLRKALQVLSTRHDGKIPVAFHKGAMTPMVYEGIDQAIAGIPNENGTKNVYAPVNRVKPTALKLIGGIRSYRNEDIEMINDLVIDIDVKRRNPDGTEICDNEGKYVGGKWASTDEEHEKAIACARSIKSHLADYNIKVYSFEDSGNGAYLKIRLDVPADAATKEIIKGFLSYLSEKFEGEHDVDIDQSIADLAQLIRLPGTYNRKLADQSLGRVQRMARFIELDESFPKTSIANIKALAKEYQAKIKEMEVKADKKDNGIDIERMLSDLSVKIYAIKKTSYGTVYVIDCPSDDSHKKKGKITVLKSGAISAGCFHATCEFSDSTGNHWQDFKVLYDIETSRYKASKSEDQLKREAEIRSAQEAEGKFHEKAMDKLRNGNPLEFDTDTVGSIHVGDGMALLQLALAKAANTCLNTDGLHPNATGDSGDGKSHIETASLQTYPIEYKVQGDTSPKSLLYMKLLPGTIAPMDDTTRFNEEKEKLFKTATTMFQEGASYDTLVDQKPVHLKLAPRISFWITSVNGSFDGQVLNRCIEIRVDGSVQQDEAVRIRQKQRNAKAEPKMLVSDDILTCREMWRILLKEPVAVAIPIELSDKYDKEVLTSNRRNYEFMSDFVKASASVFRYQRQKTEDGIVIASTKDVETALKVWRHMKDGQETKLTDKQREVLGVMVALQMKGLEISSPVLQELCKISKGRVSQILNGENGKAGLFDKVPEITDKNISESDANMQTHYKAVYELRYDNVEAIISKYRIVIPELELDGTQGIRIKRIDRVKRWDIAHSTG